MADQKQTGSEIMSTKGSSSLSLGSISAPNYLWSALGAILEAEQVRNGVLIVVSTTYSGRIGIFTNRYISGAALDGNALCGMEAVLALLSAKAGIYGFRTCLPAEAAELKHGIILDIQHLFMLREQADDLVTPADAILKKNSMPVTVQSVSPAPTPAPPAQQQNAPPPAPPTQTQQTQNPAATANPPPPRTISQVLAKRAAPQPPPAASMSPPAASDGPPAASPAQSAPLTAAPAPIPSAPVAQPATANTQPAAKSANGQPNNPGVVGNMPAAPRNPNATLSQLLPAFRPPVKNTTNSIKEYERQLTEQLDRVKSEIEKSQPKQNESENLSSKTIRDLALFNQFLQAERMRARNSSANLPAPESAKSEQSAEEVPEQPPEEDLVTLVQTHRNLMRLPKQTDEKPVATMPPMFDAPQPSLPKWWRNKWVLTGACLSAFALVLWLSCFSYATSECRKQMSDGIKLLNDNKPLPALHSFIYAAELVPDYPRVYLYLGIALAEVGDYDQALQSLNKALALGEDKHKGLVIRACVYSKMHDYDKAIEDCTSALFDAPKNDYALELRSANHFRSDQFDQGGADMDDVFAIVKAWDTRARLFRERGAAHVRLHNWQQAVDDLSKTTDTFPSERVQILLGECYRNLAQYNESVAAYSEALKINSKSYQALLGRGESTLALKQADEAMNDFNKALTVNPQGTEALLRRAEVYMDERKWQLADDDLERAVELNPYDRDAQEKLELVLRQLRKQPKPVAVVAAKEEQAEKPAAPPQDPKALFALGMKCFNGGQVDQAINCFAQLVRLQPSNPQARKYLAYAFDEQGNARDAAAQLQALNVLQPLDVPDVIMLADCMARTGQAEPAINTLTKLLEKRPDILDAQAELARIYISKGFPGKGRELAQEGLRKAKTTSQKQLFQRILSGEDNSMENN